MNSKSPFKWRLDRTRHHPVGSVLVLSLSRQLSPVVGDDVRARCGSRPQYAVSLGSEVCSRTGQAVPNGQSQSPTEEPEKEGGFPSVGEWRRKTPLPRHSPQRGEPAHSSVAPQRDGRLHATPLNGGLRGPHAVGMGGDPRTLLWLLKSGNPNGQSRSPTEGNPPAAPSHRPRHRPREPPHSSVAPLPHSAVSPSAFKANQRYRREWTKLTSR